MDYSYIIEKIQKAKRKNTPFKHLEINDLFHEDDFNKIVQSSDIQLNKANSDKSLFDDLFNKNYKVISFPGCTENVQEYIKWHKTKNSSNRSNTSCEGFGVVLRLEKANSKPIIELQKFLDSKEFKECIAEKFNIDLSECNHDAGIQKYLDGYEISPHPDVRRKALTYMVNINPNPESETEEHHTSYLKFKPEWNFVNEFWNGNQNMDRSWVPWDWCDTIKQQTLNNSIVIFSPDNNTIHAVKAKYDHLSYQRTQLYGNLWHKVCAVDSMPKWEKLAIPMGNIESVSNVKDKKLFVEKLTDFLPYRLTSKIRNFQQRKTHNKPEF